MNEGFEKSTVAEAINNGDLNTDIEPLDDIIIVETPLSEQEITELLNVAAGLDIKPFEEADTVPEYSNLPQDIDYDAVFEGLDEYNFASIEYYNTPENGDYGGYNPATNTLSINEYMLHDSDEAADTVAYELWHAYQHERAAHPQTPKDFQYQFGFDNYIRPSDDFDGYQNQLVEAETRAFADQFKGVISYIQGI